MKSCSEGCGLSYSVTVPPTTVNLDVWEKKNALEQNEEVQSGLRLLQQALRLLRTSVTNTALHGHIDTSIRNLNSINAVVNRHKIQEHIPPTRAAGLEGTWIVSSAADLLKDYVNFLRGKVQLLLSGAQACQTDVS